MNPLIVPGGRVFVWPFIQRAQKYVYLNLNFFATITDILCFFGE